MSDNTAPPALASLKAWHVGAVLGTNDAEVRIVLTDKSEARAWAAWLFDQGESNDGGAAPKP